MINESYFQDALKIIELLESKMIKGLDIEFVARNGFANIEVFKPHKKLVCELTLYKEEDGESRYRYSERLKAISVCNIEEIIILLENCIENYDFGGNDDVIFYEVCE